MPKDRNSNPPISGMPGEVRYSLPHLLRELDADRASTAFAMEKLDQESITKLFEPNRIRRGRSKSKKSSP